MRGLTPKEVLVIGDEVFGGVFDGIAGDDAAVADEAIDFAGGFEIGYAIADHDGGFGQHGVFPFADDFRFAAVASCWVIRAVARVCTIGMMMEWHGLDKANAEMFGQWLDQRCKAATKDDNGPIVIAERLQDLACARHDGIDVLLGDDLACGEIGLENLHATRKDFVQGHRAIHAGMGELDDLLEDFFAASAGEFIDAFDGR